jgi:hypothetical protein
MEKLLGEGLYWLCHVVVKVTSVRSTWRDEVEWLLSDFFDTLIYTAA